ncbi:hypothetical protein KKH23_07250 [Patescibacteria group bacterium]|uniref:Uncharacterized protein n=1 Tax=viral metagenome TaxID=1070528 RepID=A0A6M3X4P9_9ZZZZ|nr:hypothetical protein [Patescibacteria group bacterium]
MQVVIKKNKEDVIRVIECSALFAPDDRPTREQYLRFGGDRHTSNLRALVYDAEPDAYSFIYNDNEVILKPQTRELQEDKQDNTEVLKAFKAEHKHEKPELLARFWALD